MVLGSFAPIIMIRLASAQFTIIRQVAFMCCLRMLDEAIDEYIDSSKTKMKLVQKSFLGESEMSSPVKCTCCL